jgi:hypothetical protein
MTRQAARLSLRYCVSFPRKRELLPRCCHPMSLESRRRLPKFAAWRTVSAVPYGSRLPCPRGQRRRGTSPVRMKHPCLQMMTPITRRAGEDNRIASLQETEPGPGLMLRRQGGGSHVVQANAPPFGVTLAGLFATLHRWNALAALPRSGNAPGVLPTFSAQVRTRTGRIKSVLPTLTAPFYCDLAFHPYGSRAPSGSEAIVTACR